MLAAAGHPNLDLLRGNCHAVTGEAGAGGPALKHVERAPSTHGLSCARSARAALPPHASTAAVAGPSPPPSHEQALTGLPIQPHGRCLASRAAGGGGVRHPGGRDRRRRRRRRRSEVHGRPGGSKRAPPPPGPAPLPTSQRPAGGPARLRRRRVDGFGVRLRPRRGLRPGCPPRRPARPDLPPRGSLRGVRVGSLWAVPVSVWFEGANVPRAAPGWRRAARARHCGGTGSRPKHPRPGRAS